MDENARVRGMIEGNAVRALRVDVTDVAATAIGLHGLEGNAALLCTEAITAAALLSAYLDEDERLTLQIQASEPRFAVTVDVAFDGGIRARLTPSRVPETDHLRGVMFVLKSVVGREVYRGASDVDHATLERVLQHHLDHSSQVPAAIAIHGAVGAFVERIPGEALSLDDLGGLAGMVLATGLHGESQPLTWSCSCSDARVLDMLASLGRAEIQSMIDQDGGAVVDCHFCTRRAEIGVAQLRALL